MRRLGIAVLTLLLMFTAAEAKPRKAKAADANKPAAAEKKSADKSAAKADINTSSEADLEAVNGIGPATAKKIVANRPYASIEDLKKAGLTAAKIDKLRGSLTVSAAASAATSTKGSSSSSASKPSSSSSTSSSAPESSTSSSSSKPSLWERLKGKKADNASQPTSTSGTNTSAGAATTQSASAANTPQAPGGGNGKVWVNKDTKVFHREGDRWYGKTKNGEYMTERDAIAAGYRPVKEREKK